jgi:hypothetical protein
MRELTGPEVGQFADALGHAFVDPLDLGDMLVCRLGRSLADFQPAAGTYPNTRVRLVRAADADGWWYELLRAARASRPGNSSLLKFEQSLKLRAGELLDCLQVVGTPTPGARGALSDLEALERQVKRTVPYFDVGVWVSRLGEILPRVCQVEVEARREQMLGTGLLVGPDVVLTNYHVVEPAREAEAAGSSWSITCRFDYRVIPNGTTDFGRPVGLHQDWLVASGLYSPLDLQPYPKDDPDPAHLDYALLRLEAAVGQQPVGTNPESKAALRGWLSPPRTPYNFQGSEALFILQHPKGQPLKLALDLEALAVRPIDSVRFGVNANRTRVLYRTNTEEGSSGSPCFGPNWELAALHHAGDPDYRLAHTPEYNQGIPIERIVADLGHRNPPIVLPPFMG